MKLFFGIVASAVAGSLVNLPVLAEPLTANQQSYLEGLRADVTSTWYSQRIRENPATYIAVGEGACAGMRDRGYNALVKEQIKIASPMTLRLQPMGNGSYRGTLQLEMAKAVLKNAHQYLCPDAPLEK